MNAHDGFQTTICPHCKKEFVKAPKKTRTRRTSACKPVLQYAMDGQFVTRYDSLSAASAAIGVSASCISAVCRGGARQTKGFVFTYGKKSEKKTDRKHNHKKEMQSNEN